MNRLFAALGTTSVRHRRAVLVAWVGLLVFGALFAPRLEEVFEREFVTGNTGDSQAAANLISRDFPRRSAYQQQLVLRSDSVSVTDPRFRGAAESVIAVASGDGLVTSTDSYFTTRNPSFVSRDGRTTYALLNLRSTTHAGGMVSAGKVIDAVEAADTPPWLEAYVTGEEASHADLTDESQQSLRQAELFGLPIALLVLVFVFGALAAATLPLVVGVVAIAVALALAYLVGQFMDLSVFVENFATMLGLGVGIDYALFMLTRFRAERRTGRAVGDAVVETVTHAGKAIAFSGFAVVIGLAALLAAGDPTVVSMGIGGILVVLVAVAGALTLLPAGLALLGDRVEAPRALTRLLARAHRGGFWAAWGKRVARRPIVYAVTGLVVLAALAWPTAKLQTGTLGVKILGRDAQSRQGYEVMSREFGPGVIAPVEIVVRSNRGVGDPGTVAGVYRLTRALEQDRRFAGALSITTLVPRAELAQYRSLYADRFARAPAKLRPALAQLVSKGGDATIVRAFLREDPGTESSEAAVRALRSDIVPAIPELARDEVLVGGSTAREVDVTDALYDRFPLVIGLILAATFAMLMVLLRSVLIPLAAVVLNLLAALASYGLLVLTFQEGYGERLLDFDSVGSVNWITPVLLFGVLFGLSMDYQVFLLSRMRELRDRGHSHDEAVQIGIERTGGVIGGAAAIMIVVFAAFTISPIIPLKELGFGLAVAVLLAATVIQLLLIPALLRLLGERSWWLPGLLARRLPSVELERDVAHA